MLELWDFSAIVVVSGLAGAVVSALMYWLFSWQLTRDMQSVKLTVRGSAGWQKKQEKAETLKSAVAEIGAIASQGKTMEDKVRLVLEALPQLAARHPEVAIQLAKETGGGGLENLLGGVMD